jgi:hypothetical protein
MLRTGSDFGIAHQDWNAAKAEARQAMIARARMRRTIYYSELVMEISSVQFEAHDTRLNHLLGEISTEEDEKGRGMLTVVVVHKSGERSGYPGAGFFELAAELGRNVSDELKCWSVELDRVFSEWSNRAR